MKYYEIKDNTIEFIERTKAGITSNNIMIIFDKEFYLVEIKVNYKNKTREEFEKYNPNYIEKSIKYIQNKEKLITKEFIVYHINTFSVPTISKRICVLEATSSFIEKSGQRLMKNGKDEYTSKNQKEMFELFEKLARDKIKYFQTNINKLEEDIKKLNLKETI